MTRVPTIWQDGNAISYKNSLGYEIMARCINKEDYKIIRVDQFCVLFHTSSKPEFISYLRSEVKYNYLKMIEVKK